jgi:hypothetical protein
MMKIYPLSILFNVMTWQGVYSLFPESLASSRMFPLQLNATSLGSLNLKEFIQLYTNRGFIECSLNDTGIEVGLDSKASNIRKLNDQLSWSRSFCAHTEEEKGWRDDKIAAHAIKITRQEGKLVVCLVSKVRKGKGEGSQRSDSNRQKC